MLTSVDSGQENQRTNIRRNPDAHGTLESVCNFLENLDPICNLDERDLTYEQLLELHQKALISAREANDGLLKKIGELEKAEKDLLESNERLRSVVESAHDPIVGADSHGRIIRWNSAAALTFGYSEEEILNQSISILMPERFVELHEAALERAVTAGSLYYSKRVREVAGRKKDGTEFPVEVSISAWKTHEGMFFTAIIRDITERKLHEEAIEKAYSELESRVVDRTAELIKVNRDLEQQIAERKRVEEMLRTSEQLYHTLVQEVPDIIFVLDQAGKFTFLNNQAEEFLGRPLKEILETPFASYVVPEEREKICAMMQLPTNAIWDEEVRLLAANGETRFARIRCKALLGEVDETLHYEGVMRDIGRRKRLEEQLRESREALLEKIRIIDDLYGHIVEAGKARAIAEHAAEVAHELRQPLTIIGGFARRIARQLDAQDPTETEGQAASVQIISSEVQRLERILNALLDFTRRETIAPQIANPVHIIEKVCNIYQPLFAEKELRWDVSLRGDVPEISLDPDQFEQVVRNLVSNAVDASPIGQAIHIEAGISLPDNDTLKASLLNLENYFVMKIKNHGLVIKDEDLQRIFSPFFTTKPYGTGIGLTVTKKIVEAHKGYISVHSDEEGTSFIVWLPLGQGESIRTRSVK